MIRAWSTAAETASAKAGRKKKMWSASRERVPIGRRLAVQLVLLLAGLIINNRLSRYEPVAALAARALDRISWASIVDFVASAHDAYRLSRRAAFFGPTVANGALRTRLGPAACPFQSLLDLEQTLDVWQHLSVWTAVRAVANCGWSRYAALTV
jgi:hypothetical protein